MFGRRVIQTSDSQSCDHTLSAQKVQSKSCTVTLNSSLIQPSGAEHKKKKTTSGVITLNPIASKYE